MLPRQKESFRVSSSLSVTSLNVNGLVLNLFTYSKPSATFFYSGKHPVIYFIVKGNYEVTANGNNFQCPPGTAIIISDTNALPVEFAEAGTQLFAVELTPALFHNFSIPQTEFKSRIFSKAGFTRQFITMLFSEFNKDDDYTPRNIERIIGLLLVTLTREKKTSTISLPPQVTKLMKMLTDHLEEKPTLKKIAKALHRNKSYLSQIFPRYFNCSFREYKHDIMLEKAETLLTTTNLSLSDIAYQCGYPSDSHLINTFKARHNITPDQYRNNFNSERSEESK